MNFRDNIDPKELDRFTDSLAHRGPDGRGTFINGNIGLGHRRLAILDLSDYGKCPMSYGGIDGTRYWITYNGEIYNFLELRDELQRLGHVFKTETDTEIILASYAQWGKGSLLRLNGMWAFAIWDTLDRKLFIARDRFGIKPLYYSATPDRFIFASEMKAFTSLTKFPLALNSDVVPRIIQNPATYEGIMDQTLMKGVHRLLAGHYMTVDEENGHYTSKWWETSNHIPQIPITYEDQVEHFRKLFMEAVRIRMRSDVPIGTCLSGGLDSSSVACTMSWIRNSGANMERCPKDWQQTFVATFPGSKIDEKEYANEIIRHVHAKPHYWVFDENEALNCIIEYVWSMEEIYGGIGIPAWCLYRELRRNNVVVSLDGHGGDELLGGYTWYLDWQMNQINQNLYSDFHHTLLPAILRNFDRCSMAHGIEVRMPFMDYRLVTYSFALAPETKIGCGYTKRILRDAMQGVVPEKILKRTSKIGFNSPMIEWFNSGMRPLIEKVMNHELWIDSPFWNGRLLSNQVLIKTNNQAWTYNDWGETLQVWTLMNIIIWQMLFIDKNIDELK